MTEINAKNTNAEQSAFPIQRVVSGHGEDYWETPERPGLTKREYFAAMAMQGLISKERFIDGEDLTKLPRMAVEFADALLTQLNKTP